MPRLEFIMKHPEWNGDWRWEVSDGDLLLARSDISYKTEAEARAGWQRMIDAVLELHCDRIVTVDKIQAAIDAVMVPIKKLDERLTAVEMGKFPKYSGE